MVKYIIELDEDNSKNLHIGVTKYEKNLKNVEKRIIKFVEKELIFAISTETNILQLCNK